MLMKETECEENQPLDYCDIPYVMKTPTGGREGELDLLCGATLEVVGVWGL